MISRFIQGFIIDVICFQLGFCFLKVVTLGRFPEENQAEKMKYRLRLLGIFVLLAALVIIGRLLLWLNTH